MEMPCLVSISDTAGSIARMAASDWAEEMVQKIRRARDSRAPARSIASSVLAKLGSAGSLAIRSISADASAMPFCKAGRNASGAIRAKSGAPNGSWLSSSRGSRPARSDNRRNLIGVDMEAGETRGAESGGERGIGRVAAAGHEDPADARAIVARIERVPVIAEIDFEPGREIHRRIDRRDADIAEI